jgi:hypothetical protein
MYEEPRTNSLLGTIALLFRALLAYALGFWLYVFLYRMVLASREYGVSDQGVRSLIFFVLLIAVILLLLTPLMQKDTSSNARLIGAMTGFVLLVLALSQAANVFPFDANAPLPEIFRQNFAPWLYSLHLIR